MASKTSRCGSAGSMTSAMRATSASATITARATITRRSSGPRRATLASRAAHRPVRPRVGPPAQRLRSTSTRSVSSSRRSRWRWRATSSRPSGSRSTSPHSRSAVASSSGRNSKCGSTSLARSTSSSRASASASGPTGMSASSKTPRRSRLVARTRTPGHAATTASTSAATSAGRASQPSRTSRPVASRELLDHALARIGRQRGRGHDVEDRGRHRLLRGHLVERDVPHRRRRVPGRLDRQAGLARAGRADQRHDAGPRPDLRKGLLLPGPSDEAGGGAGQAGTMLHRGRHGRPAGPGPGPAPGPPAACAAGRGRARCRDRPPGGGGTRRTRRAPRPGDPPGTGPASATPSGVRGTAARPSGRGPSPPGRRRARRRRVRPPGGPRAGPPPAPPGGPPRSRRAAHGPGRGRAGRATRRGPRGTGPSPAGVGRQGLPPLGGETLQGLDVGGRVELVPVTRGRDRQAQVAQPRDVGGDRVAGGRRRFIAPDRALQLVERHAAPGLETQACQQAALAATAGGDVGRPVPDPQRPQQRDFHRRTLAERPPGTAHRPLTTNRSRGVVSSTSAPSGPHTTMSSMRAP